VPRGETEDALNIVTAKAYDLAGSAGQRPPRRRGDPESMERLHIVGLGPRTGTTLLAECMAACFEIDAFEPHEASLCEHKKNVQIYLTKNPVDLNIVGPRLRIDRHLHVIAMLRDPRDVIVSRHKLAPDHYWAPLRIWQRHLKIMQRLMRHKRFLLVRYEDLVQQPNSVQEMLMSRLPFLRQRAHLTEFHRLASPSAKSLKAMGSLRPFNAASVGNWRNHLSRVAGQISIHGSITRELIELGYERDASWLLSLYGVTPDLSPSHFPERVTLPTWRLRRRAYVEAATIAAARLLGIPLV